VANLVHVTGLIIYFIVAYAVMNGTTGFILPQDKRGNINGVASILNQVQYGW